MFNFFFKFGLSTQGHLDRNFGVANILKTKDLFFVTLWSIVSKGVRVIRPVDQSRISTNNKYTFIPPPPPMSSVVHLPSPRGRHT